MLEATVRQWQVNRSLYVLVGTPWKWLDKLSWTDAQWEAYVESEELMTFVAYYDGSPAGYFELLHRNEEVEIAYFGIALQFIGKGFGGSLLTHALKTAWDAKPNRVWVHTCTRDHPAALQNYLARGMVIYQTDDHSI